MKKNKKPLFIALLVIIALTAIIYSKYKSYIYYPVDKTDISTISIRVESGESIKDVAKTLKKNELIKSEIALGYYAKSHELDTKILPGRFNLSKSMTPVEIIATLINPQKGEKIIIIQEGLRIRDIDEKLATIGLTKKGELLEEAKNFTGWEYYTFLDKGNLESLDIPIEGYVYPDTYFLNTSDFDAHDLLYIAMDNFEKKVEGLEITHETIIMASIIENEVFGMEDKKIVSGILWKRLESNWPIGADATLLYITNDRIITHDDLNIDSAYNTRKNLGLPPGPISNPSLESIEAALNPTQSDYWFYLTTLDTGKVIYAKSNEEHNINRAKYL